MFRPRLLLMAALGLFILGSESVLIPPPAYCGHRQLDAEVDRDEILRHGDMVQKIDQGWQDDAEAAANDVMGPPADDSAKWFISVITQRGCAPCAHLKGDWAASPELSAIAKPSEPGASWSHFNWYDADDKSQAFRWSNLNVRAFPAIIVQPPRNGQFGDPSTVVAQFVGYDGDAKKLAASIVSAIKSYVAKRQGEGHRQNFGINPPWTPTPQVPVYNPSPIMPSPGLDGLLQVVPPAPTPTATPAPPSAPSTATNWIVMLALPLLGMALLYGLQTFRAQRVADGKQTLLTDEQMKQLADLISGATKPK